MTVSPTFSSNTSTPQSTQNTHQPTAPNLINHAAIFLGNIAHNAQQYIDESIHHLLKNEGIAEPVLRQIQPTDLFNVTFLEAPSTGGTGLRTRKPYTLRQIALGEPYRKTFIHIGGSSTVFNIAPSAKDYPSGIVPALEKIRDKLSDKFAQDVKQLTDSDTFREAFKKHNQGIISARIANYVLAKEGKSDAFPEITQNATNFFLKISKPRLVKYKNKIVPNMIALASDNNQALLVSTSGGKISTFEYQLPKTTHTAQFKSFLKNHLSLLDQEILNQDTFERRRPWGRGNWTLIKLNPVSFTTVDDIDTELRSASVAQIASELNRLSYTTDEEKRHTTLSYAQGALQVVAVAAGLAAATATGPGTAVIGALINVGLNISDVAIDFQLANNADRGDDYNKYMESASFGIALGVVAFAGDLGAIASTLRTVKTASANLPKPSWWKSAKAKFHLNQISTPAAAQTIVNQSQNIAYAGPTKGYVYNGLVFRGDTRLPEEIFQNGFTLRTPIGHIDEVNGFRGGFGGGHNALDPDGKGISTSAYYKRDGAGAYYYGGDKGGHTYLIDARKQEGYHLYANRHLKEHPGDTNVILAPWEINYGIDIPGSSIIGAFDKDAKFIPNPTHFANA